MKPVFPAMHLDVAVHDDVVRAVDRNHAAVGRDRVGRRAHDRREIRSSLAANVIRCERSKAEDTLLAFRPEGSANDVLCSPSSMRLLVHALDERGGAAVRTCARARAPRRCRTESAAGAAARDAVIRSLRLEVGGRRGVDVAALDRRPRRSDRDCPRGYIQRGHDLGDAGDRALVLRVLLVDDLARNPD